MLCLLCLLLFLSYTPPSSQGLSMQYILMCTFSNPRFSFMHHNTYLVSTFEIQCLIHKKIIFLYVFNLCQNHFHAIYTHRIGCELYNFAWKKSFLLPYLDIFIASESPQGRLFSAVVFLSVHSKPKFLPSHLHLAICIDHSFATTQFIWFPFPSP